MTDQLTVLVVANLGMNTGKIAAQVSHATVGVLADVPRSNPWYRHQKTVVLAVGNALELDVLCENAAKRGVKTWIVVDAGKTQVNPGTITCGAMFGDSKTIKQITKYFRLYSWDDKQVYQGIEAKVRRELEDKYGTK